MRNLNILLCAINAKYIHSNLAVYSLSAYAKQYGTGGYSVSLAEYTINQYMDEILRDLYKKRPDVLAFSCYIWNISLVEAVAAEFHKLLPDVPIFLGGPEVSYHAKDYLKEHEWATGVMRGEGEVTFTELCDVICDDSFGNLKDLKEVKGLTWRLGDGSVIETAERPLTDINAIPFVYTQPENFANKIIYYETSRGCPYSCAYCLSSIDKTVRLRDFELVKKELDTFLSQKVPQVKFVDRTFNCNKKHAMDIWQYLKEHDNGVTNFHFEISADLLTEEEVALIKTMRPGLIQLEIGVQSTNPSTISEVSRTTDLEKLEKRVAQIREGRNVHQHLDLIAGLPHEDYESFRESYRRVYNMKPDQLQLGFLKVLKGSAMEQMAEKFGIRYLDRPPYEVLYTDDLPFEDVLKLKMVEEMTEVYYNSGQFSNTMEYLAEAFDNPFDLYLALGKFYEEKGYDKVQHARIRRYEILLEFAEKLSTMKLLFKTEQGVHNMTKVLQLLTLDLYLRENMKSRPAFAKELSEYKEEIREFYREEEQTRKWLPQYEGVSAKNLAAQTHLELFTYPKEQWVLFDYKERDPLSQNARVVYIDRNR